MSNRASTDTLSMTSSGRFMLERVVCDIEVSHMPARSFLKFKQVTRRNNNHVSFGYLAKADPDNNTKEPPLGRGANLATFEIS